MESLSMERASGIASTSSCSAHFAAPLCRIGRGKQLPRTSAAQTPSYQPTRCANRVASVPSLHHQRIVHPQRTYAMPRQQSTGVPAFDIIGLGQAMVDVQFALPDESLLEQLGVPVGGRRVITVDERAHAMQLLQDSGCSSQVSAGGSVANTLVAIARLSEAAQQQAGAPPPLRVGLAGSVGTDALGQYFTAHMQGAGVQVLAAADNAAACIAAAADAAALQQCNGSGDPAATPSSSSINNLSLAASSGGDPASRPSSSGASHTGTVMVLTTPLAQRSFLSFFAADDLTPPLPAGIRAAVCAARVVMIEGYLWELPGAPRFIAEVVSLARRSGAQVVLTAGDPSVVARHRAEILEVLHLGVDVMFTNAAEAGELIGRVGCDAQVSAGVLGGLVAVAVVTDGSRGSVITALGELLVVPPHWTPEGPRDTCGAGDAYAAGLLYAVLQGHHLRTAGVFATQTASAVISRLGPQLLELDAQLLTAALPRHAHVGAAAADGAYAFGGPAAPAGVAARVAATVSTSV